MKSLKELKSKSKNPDIIPIPKSLQDIVPIRTIGKDGVFETVKGTWSKTFAFTDINYSAAGKSGKLAFALKYAEILSSLDTDTVVQITINDRKMDMQEFENSVLLPMKDDGLDRLRVEYNNIMLNTVEESHKKVRELYITISAKKNCYEEARSFFKQIENDLAGAFIGIGSKLKDMDATERLHILYDFYRAGEEEDYDLNTEDILKSGTAIKSYICPEDFEKTKDYMKIGDKYARVLMINHIATYVKDNIISRLMDIDNTSMMTLTIVPVPTEDAVEDADKRLMGVDKNITSWQQKQTNRKLPSIVVPYHMKKEKEAVEEFLDDLTNRDQKMFYVTMTLLHTADSLDKLNEETRTIKKAARKARCRMVTLNHQQYDGLCETLPLGLRPIEYDRTMTTESLLAFTPFFVQEVRDTKGAYYGKNSISKNIIMIDRAKLKNGNTMILAKPGSGKSMEAKIEQVFQFLKDDNTDVIILDAEREYTIPTTVLSGEIIEISASADTRLNLMDINEAYAIEEDKPVTLKSQFIMSVCEEIMGDDISAGEKSIIDRCVRKVYAPFVANNYKGDVPTLTELYEEIKKCDEPEAQEIALAMELFVTGSLNVFAHESNVNQDSRLLCYDLMNMDEQLQPVGMLAVLDNILNRVTRNRYSGRRTIIYVEELYLYFLHPATALFFYKLWKRIRKYNGYCVGITQNVKDLRKSDTAKTMLSNSELVILLDQAEDDMEELMSLLKISEEQMKYVTNADEGCGLMKVGKNIIPFNNKIPKDTELYKIMTTKPDEAMTEV